MMWQLIVATNRFDRFFLVTLSKEKYFLIDCLIHIYYLINFIYSVSSLGTQNNADK